MSPAALLRLNPLFKDVNHCRNMVFFKCSMVSLFLITVLLHYIEILAGAYLFSLFLLITNPIVQNIIERYQRALKQSLFFIACTTRLESLASHQTCFPWDLFLFRQLIVCSTKGKKINTCQSLGSHGNRTFLIMEGQQNCHHGKAAGGSN